MADSPAEYVAELERENRASRAALATAHNKIEELELALAHSDELRATWVAAARDASQNLVSTLGRLEIYEPIVEAAVEYFEADGRGETHINLMRATEPEIRRRETSS